MAPVSSLSSQSLQSQIFNSTTLSTPSTRFAKCRNSSSSTLYLSNKKNLNDPRICVSMEEEEEEEKYVKKKESGRREALFGIMLASFSSQSLVSNALAENNDLDGFGLYSDDTKKFKILIPRNWQVGEGESDGIRSLTAFYPEEASNTNVSVLISGLGADYTKLESFGKVDEFAETLVSGLDRSWQNPPGVAAKLINSKSSKGMYYIEYTLQKPGESSRHIYSVLGMLSSTWYNKLYTVTGQFMEDEADKYKSKVVKMVSSFNLIT